MPDRFRRLSTVQRYLAALALIATATLVRWALNPLLGTTYPYLLQFFAVLAAARYFGFGPAIAGLFLGTSPLVFGVEIIPRPPTATGSRFWVTIAIVYAISVI